MLRKDLAKISKEDLWKAGRLSTRAYNVCCRSRLNTLADILLYFESGQSFKHIKQAGTKTQEELFLLSKEVVSNLEDDDVRFGGDYFPVNGLEIRKSFEALGEEQKAVLELWYDKKKRELKAREFHAVEHWTLEDFYREVWCCPDFSFHRLPHIGKFSIEGLEKFRLFLEKKVEELSGCEERQIVLEKAILRYGNFCADPFVLAYWEERKHLPMFWLLGKKLESQMGRDYAIFRETFPLYENQTVRSLEEVAAEKELSKERVRQIRNQVLHDLFNDQNVFFQTQEDWTGYLPEIAGEVASSSSYNGREMNVRERTHFSSLFIFRIFAFVFDSQVKLIGEPGTLKRGSISWNNTFLVRSRIFEIFDFDRFREDVESRLSNERSEDWICHINDYLDDSLCWKEYDLEEYDAVKTVVLEIFLQEFRLYLDDEDRIVIPANKEKPTEEIVKILEENGRPMYLQEIFKRYGEKFPYRFSYPKQLRSSMTFEDRIVAIGRSGRYALKEWNVNTGTIREVIVEFLSKKGIPQTDQAITDYVLKYYPDTNCASIRSTIYEGVEAYGFVFYEKGLFGLKNKDYPSSYIVCEKPELVKKSFEARLADFENFIQEKEHFPFSVSTDKEELTLYRWWKSVLDKKKSLTALQEKKVEEIQVKYARIKKDKWELQWEENLKEIRHFFLTFKRLPKDLGDEKNCLKLWKRLKKDYTENKLTEAQRRAYLELCKLLN
ncbi:hypothetical protein [Odoribacter laneus]|uniref:hypothetical protein n=1 Tax=Odoribacter laneus TaxID=626933 RepID=UPI0023F02186|nr:hypothetical protein [Odoribacter laneus]